jgi:DNA helicase II / ATP-dependent DNA helicase PcrA
MSEYLQRVADIEADPDQRQAFNRPFEGEGKSCVVIAGPGSGKTYLLTAVVARLLFEKIPAPRGVACLTYSNFLVRQLEDDLKKLGVFGNPRLFIGTVHSFCLAEIIHPYKHLYEEVNSKVPQPFRIASQQQSENAICSALLAQGIDYEEHVNIQRWGQDWQGVIRYLEKYRRQNPDYDNRAFQDPQWTSLDFACRAVLQQVNWGQLAFQYVHDLLTNERPAIDFTEIEIIALKMVRQHDFVRTILLARYPWLVIDEYQDLGTLFHKMVRHLVSDTNMRIFAIGDPDQCIYEDLSGTKPEYIDQLSTQILMREESRKVILTRNYRNAQNLINISEKILGEARGYIAIVDGGTCNCYECADEDEQQELLFNAILPSLTDNPNGYSISLQDIAILHPWRRSGVNAISKKLDHFESRWPHTLDKDVDYDSSHSEIIGWLEQIARWNIYGWRDGDPYFRDLLPFWLRLNTDPHSQNLRTPHMELQLKLFTILWEIRQHAQVTDFGNWLQLIEENLELGDLLSEYEIIAPDDVAEYNRLRENLEGDRLSNWTLSRFAKGPGRIQLTTFHSSKGTQFEVVIIMGLGGLERLPPRGINRQRRRLAYVAMTRAKNRVFVLYEGQSQLLQGLRNDLPIGCNFWERCGSGNTQADWQRRLA